MIKDSKQMRGRGSLDKQMQSDDEQWKEPSAPNYDLVETDEPICGVGSDLQSSNRLCLNHVVGRLGLRRRTPARSHWRIGDGLPLKEAPSLAVLRVRWRDEEFSGAIWHFTARQTACLPACEPAPSCRAARGIQSVALVSSGV